MTPVERMARAIDPVSFRQFEGLRDYGLRVGDSEEEALAAATWAHGSSVMAAKGTARDALMAIREPSKAMIEAALSRSHADAPETMYHSIWKSMIDAALSET